MVGKHAPTRPKRSASANWHIGAAEYGTTIPRYTEKTRRNNAASTHGHDTHHPLCHVRGCRRRGYLLRDQWQCCCCYCCCYCCSCCGFGCGPFGSTFYLHDGRANRGCRTRTTHTRVSKMGFWVCGSAGVFESCTFYLHDGRANRGCHIATMHAACHYS